MLAFRRRGPLLAMCLAGICTACSAAPTGLKDASGTTLGTVFGVVPQPNPPTLGPPPIGVIPTTSWTPASAPPCTRQQLTLSSTSTPPGDTEDLGTLLRFVDSGNAPCSLEGYPSVVGSLSGEPTVVAQHDPATGSLPPGIGGPTVIVETGEAFVRVRVPPCNAAFQPSPVYYRDLTVSTPALGPFSVVSGVPLALQCGMFVSPFYV